MSECSHDCSSCSQNCADRDKKSFLAEPNKGSNVKKVIGIVSGKGGVGKSMVTCMMSVLMNRKGYTTAVLDADITGPSVPKAFGITERAYAEEDGLIPAVSGCGTKVMSINLLLEDTTDPVVWRGPVIGGTVKQFWTDVVWGDVDYMFVDMPPGTGDVPLTVFQSLPVDGIIIVTSPQELVSMIVEKAAKMAKLMDIPVIGIVENMSYFECPDCGKHHNIFGSSNIDALAERLGIGEVAKLPVNPQIAALADSGKIEDFGGEWLDDMADVIEKI